MCTSTGMSEGSSCEWIFITDRTAKRKIQHRFWGGVANERPTMYTVFVYDLILSNLCFHPDPPVVEGNVESAKVIDLIPWMEYEFRIMATNILGTGEPSIPSQKIRTEGSRTYT